MMALLDGPWKDPLSGYPNSPDIRTEAEFPILLRATRLHLGVLLAVVAAIAVWLLIAPHHARLPDPRRRREPATPPRYAGIPVGRGHRCSPRPISGALAGLAGVGEVGGVHFQVMAGLSPGYGYTGIVIAMLARAQPARRRAGGALLRHHHHRRREHVARRPACRSSSADVIQGMSLISHAGGAAVHRLPASRRPAAA